MYPQFDVSIRQNLQEQGGISQLFPGSPKKNKLKHGKYKYSSYMNELLLCFDVYNKLHLKNIKEDSLKLIKINKMFRIKQYHNCKAVL